jgi:hypothetical protein
VDGIYGSRLVQFFMVSILQVLVWHITCFCNLYQVLLFKYESPYVKLTMIFELVSFNVLQTILITSSVVCVILNLSVRMIIYLLGQYFE